jgi:hypothetical protein
VSCLLIVGKHRLACFECSFGIALFCLGGDDFGAGEEEAYQDEDDADDDEEFDEGEALRGNSKSEIRMTNQIRIGK